MAYMDSKDSKDSKVCRGSKDKVLHMDYDDDGCVEDNVVDAAGN